MINVENIGACEFWDAKPFIDAANILTAADEPLMALKLLDMVPAYYRDHEESEIHSLKKKITSKLVTPVWYSTCHDQIAPQDKAIASVNHTRRGSEVFRDVKKLNEMGITPHVTELAPGEYWLPLGMKALGLSFTYYALNLNYSADTAAREMLNWTHPSKADGPKIYCAFEVIEHLHYENDIAVECQRLGITPDIIHLSTPLYTYDGRKESLAWEGKDLGHIRTYTPIEFANVVSKMFKGYTWHLWKEQVMHLRGFCNEHFKL